MDRRDRTVRLRAAAATTSTIALVAAWAAAIVAPPSPDPASASQHTGTAPVAVPDVHIDGLATPEASRTTVPARGTLTAVSTVAHRLPPSQIPTAAQLAYRRAAQVLAETKPTCRLDWSLLAGIGRIESDHGRYGGNTVDASGDVTPGIYGIPLDGENKTARISDTDGGRWDNDDVWDRAVGPMQFIPSTWAAVAVDANDDGVADPQNIYDAALAAGVYLCAGGDDLGTDAGTRAAVFSYNHSEAYVNQVLAMADAYANGESLAALPPLAVPEVNRPTSGPEAGARHTVREPDHKSPPAADHQHRPQAEKRPTKTRSPRQPKATDTDERPVNQTAKPPVKHPRNTDQPEQNDGDRPADGDGTVGEDKALGKDIVAGDGEQDAADTNGSATKSDADTHENATKGDDSTDTNGTDTNGTDTNGTDDTDTDKRQSTDVVCVIEDGELASCHDANDRVVVEDYACTFDDKVLTLGKPTEVDLRTPPVCEFKTPAQ